MGRATGFAAGGPLSPACRGNSLLATALSPTGRHPVWTDWAEPMNAWAIVCTMRPVPTGPAARHRAPFVSGAAADTTALAPYTSTAAGQKALIAALRARVGHQRQVVAAYRARDARMAALLRSMVYSPRTPGGAGGAIPLGGSGFSLPGPAGLGGGSPLAGVPTLPALAGARRNGAARTMLAARVDGRAEAVPAGAGGVAATAALQEQGTPYVWGAKGPDRFDCSGLTQWAWAQAGVRLGPDTYTQVTEGVPVPPGEVRAGDLIFPKDSFDAAVPAMCSWRFRRLRWCTPRRPATWCASRRCPRRTWPAGRCRPRRRPVISAGRDLR